MLRLLVAWFVLSVISFSLPVNAAETRTALRRDFAAAFAAYDARDDRAAIRAFEKLRHAYPALGDYHRYFLAELYLRNGRQDEARKALAQLLVETPASIFAPKASLELGRLHASEGDAAGARVFLERAAVHGDDETAAAAGLVLAELAFRTTDARTAHVAFMEVRRRASGKAGLLAKEYLDTLETQDPSLRPRGEAALDEMDRRNKEGDFSGALHLARVEHEASPGLRSSVLQRRATALFGLGKEDEGFAALWEIVERHPGTPEAPKAMYRIASTLWNRDRDSAALKVFRQYLKRYPRARASDARYAIGRIHEAAGRIDEAKAAYRDLAARSPHGTQGRQARWQLGWIEYRRGELWEAAKVFADLATRTEGHEYQAAMYWRARCHHRLGRLDRAKDLYSQLLDKRSYYALWAARRLEQMKSGSLPALNVDSLARGRTVEPVRLPRTSPSPAARFHWSRFTELAVAGLPSLARVELEAVEERADTDTATRQVLLRAYRSIDRHRDALRLLQKLGANTGLSRTDRKKIYYPLAFWPLVRDAAHARRLDPLLVQALMRQESLFDPEIRSPANAVGLMQLLPSTARRVAERPDMRGVDGSALTDPATNIQLGVAYLGGLVDDYGGDVFRALAAYNGGEAAVAKWDSRSPGVERDEWVESISYRETRDYVKRVIGHYVEYKDLWG